MVEVDGIDVGAGHPAVVIHDERAKVGAVDVFAGLDVAPRAGGVLVVDPLPAFELLTALGIKNDEGAAWLVTFGDEGDLINQPGQPVLILHHVEFDLLVAPLAARLGFAGGILWREGGDRACHILIDLAQHAPAGLLQLAVQALVSYHHLTHYRDAVPDLLVADPLLAVGQLDHPHLTKLAIFQLQGTTRGTEACHGPDAVCRYVDLYLLRRQCGASPAGQRNGQINFIHLFFP